ncbi:MAG: hypothetical protein IPG89_19725 [Bacteroidetes bacterium]|nr:hypothetical protein [Bacteroidota bacterium]
MALWKKHSRQNASALANQLYANETVTFTEVLNKKWGWQYAAFYTTGAVFCKAAYDKGGVSAVKKLLETRNDDEKLVETICTLFKIDKEEINAFWRNEVLKFKTK